MKRCNSWSNARSFSPLAIPEGWWRNGVRCRSVRHQWGEVRLEMQRLVDGQGKHQQIFFDPSLDGSGWTPHALACLIDLGARMAYEEAVLIAGNFGLAISAPELWRSVAPYAETCREDVSEQLAVSAFEPLAVGKPESSGRVMVLHHGHFRWSQLEGVMVLGKPDERPNADAVCETDVMEVEPAYELASLAKAEPSDGVEKAAKKRSCPGMEIKSAVLYPQQSPGERHLLADIKRSGDLLPLVSGLLRASGVSQQDTLVGLGDGASWIAQYFARLGAIPITDVYHSASYLDEVMKAMNWSDAKRTHHRRKWLRGEISARDWLNRYLPEDPDVWLRWSKEAQFSEAPSLRTALRYLEERQDSMDYPDYRAKDYPIGSEQVEGMNKSVIGNRLKRSGMQWTQEGAADMASLRAQICAKHSLVDFDALRHKAYPILQS